MANVANFKSVRFDCSGYLHQVKYKGERFHTVCACHTLCAQ